MKMVPFKQNLEEKPRGYLGRARPLDEAMNTKPQSLITRTRTLILRSSFF